MGQFNAEEYTFTVERLHEIFPELEPHWREHYATLKAKHEGQGLSVPDYDPRIDFYFKASKDGWLKTFVARYQGKVVGYSTIYISHDMHNRSLIAQEDFIYVTPTHRNGTGRKLTKFVLDNLRQMGVTRFHVTAITDTRATILWKRMGFKELGTAMIYNFEAA